VGRPLVAEELSAQGHVLPGDFGGVAVDIGCSGHRQVDSRELLEKIRAIARGELRHTHRRPGIQRRQSVCGTSLRAAPNPAARDKHSIFQRGVRRDRRRGASGGGRREVPHTVGGGPVDDELDKNRGRHTLIQTTVVADEKRVHPEYSGALRAAEPLRDSDWDVANGQLEGTRERERGSARHEDPPVDNSADVCAPGWPIVQGETRVGTDTRRKGHRTKKSEGPAVVAVLGLQHLDAGFNSYPLRSIGLKHLNGKKQT